MFGAVKNMLWLINQNQKGFAGETGGALQHILFDVNLQEHKHIKVLSALNVLNVLDTF